MREYYGYLMSGRDDQHTTTYECMDNRPEALPGGTENMDGALFYHVEGVCGGILCPPYIDGQELSCVVCSK